MALFKVYHGDKNDLPGELKDSYGYIVVNEEASAGTWIDDNNEGQDYGIGEWYIDTDTKRYRIAAAELVDEEGNLYSLDDIVQKENIVEDLAGTVYNSNTDQSALTTPEELELQRQLRVGIGVAKDEDSITKAFTITVLVSQWVQDQERQGYYKNVVGLPEVLHCGSPNAGVPVPPLISWNGVGSKAIYNVFEEVILNDNRNTLTFYVTATDYAIVGSNVGITVIDHR